MPETLRIVVLGYYGHLNAGDDLLQASICSIFKEHELMFSKWFPGIDLINQADLLVVGGGSIWPGHTVFQHAKELSRRLRVPLFVIGISAKEESRQCQVDTGHLIRYASYFHVRDQNTKDLLGGDSAITVGTDLYWWSEHYLPARLASEGRRSAALNLRAWNSIEWRPADIVSTLKEKGIKISSWPLYYGSSSHERSGDMGDVELLSGVLGITETPSSFSTEPILSASFSVCMRFHALLVSVRAGKPAIGFDYHLKTKTFFEENGLPELCVDIRSSASLSDAIDRVTADYSSYQAKFQAVRNRLLTQGRRDRSMALDALSKIQRRRVGIFERYVDRFKRASKRLLT